MKNFDWITPTTAKEAVDACATGRSFMAGGTDLITLMKAGLHEPAGIISLSRVTGLDEIIEDHGGITIGARVTLAQVAEHVTLQRRASAIADAARSAATPLVRNRATVGGNLGHRPRCWYFRHPDYPCSKKGGDTCFAIEGENKYHAIFDNTTCNIVHPSNLGPAFMAHDAEVQILGPKGERKLSIHEFWVRPEEDMRTEIALDAGELITRIDIKPMGARTGSAFEEVNEKQSFDWGLVAAAVRLTLDGDKATDVRIILGAVAPVPLRREEAEKVLSGSVPTEQAALAAAEKAIEGATPLRDNHYKVAMLKACIKNAILMAAARARKAGG